MTEYDFVEELRLFMNNMIQENKTKSSDAVKGIGEEILDWIESLIVSLFIVMLIFTFVFRQVSVIVITSYSIHYTKLYEVAKSFSGKGICSAA